MNIRVKFQLTMSQEQVIWKFINESIFRKKVILKEQNPNTHGRVDVRVTFKKSVVVRIKVFETSKLPEQEINAQLNDFSLGGLSCELSEDDFVMPGSEGLMELSFIAPPQTVKITIL